VPAEKLPTGGKLYPRTGVPDKDTPPDWDAIPGARGCTPQNCAFRDHYDELRALGSSVYGLSTQTTDYQARDGDATPPAVSRGTTIAHVIYPVFPSNADAPAAVAWLEEQT